MLEGYKNGQSIMFALPWPQDHLCGLTQIWRGLIDVDDHCSYGNDRMHGYSTQSRSFQLEPVAPGAP